MLFSSLLIQFLFQFGSSEVVWYNYDGRTDAEKVKDYFNCDDECFFGEPEINSTTIVRWPSNCTTVCGLMNFYQSSDVTEFQLQGYFENLKVFKGVIKVSETKYAFTSFFSTLETIECSGVDVYLNRNPYLEEVNFDNLKSIGCLISSNENPNLNETMFCEKYQERGQIYVPSRYQWNNCKYGIEDGCVGGTVYTWDTKNMTNCSKILSGLRLMGKAYGDYEYDMSGFFQVQNITFELDIHDTALANLSFFKSLRHLKGGPFGIDMCENMTRLGLESLEVTITRDDGFYRFSFGQLHSDFCVTTGEMKVFLRNNVQFDSLPGIYCPNETREGLCEYAGMSSLKSNCTEIVGRIRVGREDVVRLEKLANVSFIFGSLTIESTNITNLDFLANLQYISLLNDTLPAFQLIQNNLLENVQLPNLKRAFSVSKYQMVLLGNNPTLLDSNSCLKLTGQLVLTSVAVDNEECGVDVQMSIEIDIRFQKSSTEPTTPTEP